MSDYNKRDFILMSSSKPTVSFFSSLSSIRKASVSLLPTPPCRRGKKDCHVALVGLRWNSLEHLWGLQPEPNKGGEERRPTGNRRKRWRSSAKSSRRSDFLRDGKSSLSPAALSLHTHGNINKLKLKCCLWCLSDREFSRTFQVLIRKNNQTWDPQLLLLESPLFKNKKHTTSQTA